VAAPILQQSKPTFDKVVDDAHGYYSHMLTTEYGIFAWNIQGKWLNMQDGFLQIHHYRQNHSIKALLNN